MWPCFPPRLGHTSYFYLGAVSFGELRRTAISLESDIRFYTKMLEIAISSVDFWTRYNDNDDDNANLLTQKSRVRKYRMKVRWAEQKLSDICR